MITTRYTADMLYMNKDDRIMPSFYGSIALTYVIGGIRIWDFPVILRYRADASAMLFYSVHGTDCCMAGD